MAFTYPWQAGALMLVLVGGGMVACERRAPQQELTGSGVTQPLESRPPEAQTDTGITTAVQAEYYRDDLVRGRRIDVTTENGVVTLEGTVRSDEVKQRAVDLAQGVGGVTRVDDQLIVQQQSAAAGDTRGPSAGEEDRARPTGTAGSAADRLEAGWITTKINALYFVSDDVSPFNIEVTTSPAGVVTLAGEVENAQQRAEAVRIARSTEGVTEVVDRIRSKGERRTADSEATSTETAARDDAGDVDIERPDVWLTTKVQAKYFLDDAVKGRNIDVTTREGVVTLTGTVGSEAERRQAIALARNTDGVLAVTDQLQMQSDASAPDRDQPVQPVRSLDQATHDTRITMVIQSKYFLDDQVKGLDIDVDTRKGVVTLSGRVGDATLKEQAEQIARETEGVSSVVNRITVGAGS